MKTITIKIDADPSTGKKSVQFHSDTGVSPTDMLGALHVISDVAHSGFEPCGCPGCEAVAGVFRATFEGCEAIARRVELRSGGVH